MAAAAAALRRRPSHLALALACLSLLHLLGRADTSKQHLGHSRTTTTSISLLLLAPDGRHGPTPAGWPASSHHHLRAPPSPSTLPDSSAPRFLDASATGPEESTVLATPRNVMPAPPSPREAVASSVGPHASTALPVAWGRDTPSAPREPANTAASPRAARPAPPQRPRGCALHNHKRTAAVEASIPAPRGATCPAKTKTLLHALPLLAVVIPFLPPPVAALVAFSSLVAPARAYDGSDCSPLTHASCAVYGYDNHTGTIDWRRPDPSLNAACELPLCHPKRHSRAVLHALQHGRGDDPLLIYCRVRVLKNPPSSMLPWKKNVWLTLIPVADPAAAAGSGDRVCYVELMHLGYREGYYIRCPSPNRDGSHSSCTAFPEQEGAGEIAAAVWEHRRINYRDTVWPQFVTPAEKHDEL